VFGYIRYANISWQPVRKWNSRCVDPVVRSRHQTVSKPFDLPLPTEPRQAFLAGEELLHGGLFEVALLGDESIQRADQCIHIAQRLRDGALFYLPLRPCENKIF